MKLGCDGFCWNVGCRLRSPWRYDSLELVSLTGFTTLSMMCVCEMALRTEWEFEWKIAVVREAALARQEFV